MKSVFYRAAFVVNCQRSVVKSKIHFFECKKYIRNGNKKKSRTLNKSAAFHPILSIFKYYILTIMNSERRFLKCSCSVQRIVPLQLLSSRSSPYPIALSILSADMP